MIQSLCVLQQPYRLEPASVVLFFINIYSLMTELCFFFFHFHAFYFVYTFTS